MLRRLRNKPPREVAAQVVRRLAGWSDLAALEFPLLPGDIADSQSLAGPARRRSQDPARVGWIVVPPGAGSGGHTTFFRMIRAAVEGGLASTLLFYDRYHGDFAHNERVVRTSWPWLEVDIRPVEERLTGFDAIVASSWPTAHVLARRGADIPARLYFIQDFEPYFYPRGGTAALAEDSYRFGFRNVALGHMVQACLDKELGVGSELVEFGLDTGVYRILPDAPARSGVVYYNRNGNDRRGQPLALRALEAFHRTHPDEPIHIYGDKIAAPSFRAIQHGNLSPEALNVLYNSTYGGIALSFTNVSLVPEEMLAAGGIPVVNDSWMTRAELRTPFVEWSLPTPSALTAALTRIVDRPAGGETRRAAAATVTTRRWEQSGADLASIIRDEMARSGGRP